MMRSSRKSKRARSEEPPADDEHVAVIRRRILAAKNESEVAVAARTLVTVLPRCAPRRRYVRSIVPVLRAHDVTLSTQELFLVGRLARRHQLATAVEAPWPSIDPPPRIHCAHFSCGSTTTTVDTEGMLAEEQLRSSHYFTDLLAPIEDDLSEAVTTVLTSPLAATSQVQVERALVNAEHAVQQRLRPIFTHCEDASEPGCDTVVILVRVAMVDAGLPLAALYDHTVAARCAQYTNKARFVDLCAAVSMVESERRQSYAPGGDHSLEYLALLEFQLQQGLGRLLRGIVSDRVSWLFEQVEGERRQDAWAAIRDWRPISDYILAIASFEQLSDWASHVDESAMLRHRLVSTDWKRGEPAVSDAARERRNWLIGRKSLPLLHDLMPLLRKL